MPLPRRTVLAAVPAMTAAGLTAPARAATPGPAWQFAMPAIDEATTLDFATFRGKVLLVVNTASFCGYTPQYKTLEAMYRDLGARGLVVIGIPSQDFGQEQDSNESVRAFCELTYGVEFPMSAIAHVTGVGAAPFYRWVKQQTGWEPGWNFAKVLIGRDGTLRGTWTSDAAPDAGPLRTAIDTALQQPPPA